MSLKPIVLYRPKHTISSDDACTTIKKYSLAPAPSAVRAPYQTASSDSEASEARLSYIPSLAYFCIKSVIEYPEQLHTLGPQRILYTRPAGDHDFDILRALIPSYRPLHPRGSGFNLRQVDPRLWAVLIQIFNELPPIFRRYPLPLSDTHMPLLQLIPNTPHFSLVTVLALRGREELTDDTVLELRHLHTLTALDASGTALGSFGVQRLAKTLTWSESESGQDSERRGPWGLRVLHLRNCINVDDKVLECLSRFPLLSVVGQYQCSV